MEEKRGLLNTLVSKIASKLPESVSESLNTLSKKTTELKISQRDLIAKNNILQQNYDEINQQYLEVVKQSERYNSTTIQRINAIKKESDSHKHQNGEKTNGKEEGKKENSATVDNL